MNNYQVGPLSLKLSDSGLRHACSEEIEPLKAQYSPEFFEAAVGYPRIVQNQFFQLRQIFQVCNSVVSYFGFRQVEAQQTRQAGQMFQAGIADSCLRESYLLNGRNPTDERQV